MYDLRSFLILTLLALFPPRLAADATQPDKTRYIQGSWVNIRSGPTSDAPVSDHLVVNTKVRLIDDYSRSDYCEVEWEQKHGFVSCKLLGTKPIPIEEVGGHYTLSDGEPNPKSSPLRAFWIDPSIDWLWRAGEYFEQNTSTGASKHSDHEATAQRKPSRPPIPEFDAMKAHLHQGIERANPKPPIIS